MYSTSLDNSQSFCKYSKILSISTQNMQNFAKQSRNTKKNTKKMHVPEDNESRKARPASREPSRSF